MKEKIAAIIKTENLKRPWTDEEIARQLGVLREDVTNTRGAMGIEDSRGRRRPVVLNAMKGILAAKPDISDRALSKALEEMGFEAKKFAVSRLRQELAGQWEAEGHQQKQELAGIEPVEAETAMEAAMEPATESKAREVFSAFIGYDGSVKHQIAKAQAAILYPPMGLHCLLYGPSGVGKSFLAELMFAYACQTENFGSHVPYFEFNCADYADNPQLLLAQLFGYSKGAFTGATEHKKGVVELCNGGILFLDEVHRLPPEGQEILFYLIDKGKFRRLGEVEVQRESRVLVIAATTEEPHNSLLLTFRRRIPMIIEIPALKDRPLEERMVFMERFFKWESVRLGRKIRVKAEVLACLLAGDYPGNVGQLKADIQVCCAKAFLESKKQKRNTITVTAGSLADSLKRETHQKSTRDEIARMAAMDLYLSPDETPVNKLDFLNEWNIYADLEEKYARMKSQGLREDEIERSLSGDIEERLVSNINEIQNTGFSKEEIGNIVGAQVLAVAEDIYALAKTALPSLEEGIIFPLAIHLKAALDRHKSGNCMVSPDIKAVSSQFQKEYPVARQVLDKIEKIHYIAFGEQEAGFVAMYLNRFCSRRTDTDSRICVLVLSHGEVAQGMAAAANAIMGVDHAQGLNLNLWDTPGQMVEKVLQMAARIHQGRGILVLADMGSLSTIGKEITERLGIPARTITRTDTVLVIEAVRKTMWTEESLEEIAAELSDFRGLGGTEGPLKAAVRKKAVLCLCITGEGAARQLKEQIVRKLESYLDDVCVVTRGYIEHVRVDMIVADVEKSYEVLAIAGTIDPGIPRYPFVSVSRIYGGDGIKELRNILKLRKLEETNRLKEVICKDRIWVNPGVQFKDEVLDMAVGKMVEEGLVLPEYLLSVYKREGMMTTVLKHGIAIPHGDPLLVTKPAICITKLDKPVVWDGINVVDLVFTLALTEDSKIYFEQLYQFLSNETLIKTLKNSDSRDAVLKFLGINTETVS